MTQLYERRAQRVQKLLAEEGVEALLVDDEVNRYYMTGLTTSCGFLIIYQKEVALLVDGRYYELCQKKSPFPVYLLGEKETRLTDLIEGKVKTIGYNSQQSYKGYIELEKKLNKTRLVCLDNPLKKIRAVKDPEEIAALRAASELGLEGFDFLVENLREGVTEKVLAQELDIFWKRKGSQGLGFDPIVAFGENSSMPHYQVSSRSLKKGDTVLLDIGVKFQHYHSDMTRVLFFGEPSEEMHKIYHVVKEAQEAALALCRPGTRLKDLDAAARMLITDKGYGPQFSHALGHGVGLEIHEDPSITFRGKESEQQIEVGMVFTVEPGVYVPNVGGVRIEDTIVVTEEGHENLTKRSKEMQIVPNLGAKSTQSES